MLNKTTADVFVHTHTHAEGKGTDTDLLADLKLRSLTNKMFKLPMLTQKNENTNIMCITETWLQFNVVSPNIFQADKKVRDYFVNNKLSTSRQYYCPSRMAA